MSIFNGQVKPATPAIRCVCCDAPETGGEVWESPVCYACFGAWMADERFSSGVINQALGISNRVEDFTEANHQRYLAESRKRTAAWVLERKALKARAA